MCGIAGYQGVWPDRLLTSMTAALRHRGPDGEGTYFDRAAGLALGHTRLAIIDLSRDAAQPMASNDGRFVIVFNGEIYNYRELRSDLVAQGVRFRTQSDTEVLLGLFALEGLRCLEKINGIFAFAIWDTRERRLTLVRDELGVKPLYYAALPNGFLFASELKALTLCPDLSRDIDPATALDHLGFIWTAGRSTMLKSVRKLRPGCAMIVDASGTRLQQYYRAPIPGQRSSGSPASAEELTDLIDRVVKDQMVADVEVGALLSGGVDSSAVVAAMCRATDPGKITTLCADVKSGDEAASDNIGEDPAYARRVAQYLGVRNIAVSTDVDLIDELPSMLWGLDEPTSDFAALQTLRLAQEARQCGIKVLLSGIGGDDLFAGYNRHKVGLLFSALDNVPCVRRIIGSVLAGLPPKGTIGRRLQRVGALLGLTKQGMLAEAMNFSAIGSEQRTMLLAPDLRKDIPDNGVPAALHGLIESTEGQDIVSRFLVLELCGFLPDHNLNYTDKMAMLAGVEVRVPLIDKRLVAFAMELPTREKVGLFESKKILRRSQAGRLPAAVLARPKQGFGVPIRAWLHGPARPLLEALTTRSVINRRGLFNYNAVEELKGKFFANRVDAAFTFFSMMAIELWCQSLDKAPFAK